MQERSDDKVYAHITSVRCESVPPPEPLMMLMGDDPPEQPFPKGGGGGGNPPPPQTYLYLNVIDVTDWQNVETRMQFELSSAEPGCSDPEWEAPANLGLAFSLDGTTLFVTDPYQDRVDVFNATADPPSLSSLVAVGSNPVDVMVVRRGGVQERAYVLTRGDSQSVPATLPSINQIDVATMTRLTPDMFFPDTSYHPVAVDARSDGLWLFTANSDNETISAFRIDPSQSNGHVEDIVTGGNTTRIVTLRIP